MNHKKPNNRVSQLIFTTISVTCVLQNFSRETEHLLEGILHVIIKTYPLSVRE